MGASDLIKETFSQLTQELALDAKAEEARRHAANAAILKAASEAAGKVAQRFAKARATLSRLAWAC